MGMDAEQAPASATTVLQHICARAGWPREVFQIAESRAVDKNWQVAQRQPPGGAITMSTQLCSDCGSELPAPKPIGRPRIRCESCAADKAAIARAWQTTHRAQYNARRREDYWRARLRKLRSKGGESAAPGARISPLRGIKSAQAGSPSPLPNVTTHAGARGTHTQGRANEV